VVVCLVVLCHACHLQYRSSYCIKSAHVLHLGSHLLSSDSFYDSNNEKLLTLMLDLLLERLHDHIGSSPSNSALVLYLVMALLGL
jgi:hypothetical protein